MDVQIFENQPESDNDDQIIPELDHKSTEIESSAPFPDEAAHQFVNSVYFKRETIPAKVQRIRRDILELKEMGAHTEAQSLIDELKEAVHPEGSQTSARNIDNLSTKANYDDSHAPITSTEFVNIEKRVANLEKLLGASVRAPSLTQPLYCRLQSLSESIALLSMDKESLLEKVKVISSASSAIAPSDEVKWLYSRLHKYDLAIEALPSLVSRLQTLNRLHSSWVQTDDRINNLESQLDLLKNEIDAWKKSLDTMESSINRYVETSNENMRYQK